MVTSRLGMKLALADVDVARLQEAAREAANIIGEPNVLAVPTDVSKLNEVVHLRDKVYEAWGEVSSQRSAVV